MSKFCLIASFPMSVLKFRGDLLKDLSKKGLEIHIILPNLNDSIDYELRNIFASFDYHLHEVSLQRTGLNPLADIKTLYQIFKKLKEIRPDYVLAYTIKPVLYGMLAARFANVPKRFALITGLGYAFQGIDDNDHKSSKLQKIIFMMYKASLKKTQNVIFQNPDDMHLFRKLGILSHSAKSCVVNGSGVNTEVFQEEAFPLNSEGVVQPHFLLIARLLGDKGVREYAEAAKQIKIKYPEAMFSLVGWIDTNPDAIAQAELDEWVSDGRLNYLGKLTDVRAAISGSSIYVLPSYREGTPRTVLEAMSMGRPIITTDAPGCRETVVNGENGFLIDVKSVSSLIKAMEKFIESPELIQTMGKSSRRMAEDKFDVKKVNQAMLHEMEIF
ncbi:glycosyltransferase family 4 protein [Oligella urethralis]|uniref:Glycosyl transferase n=1 Tax=Oligella urethralis DNF00040 TaxID=1401065 RepID=A0A095YTS7_9BURK|nr:glycosyltransferase family 4 protein [Oligella urethralis]KGF25800.1 glycosyl transferase [Oligella urethralis DNF00040]